MLMKGVSAEDVFLAFFIVFIVAFLSGGALLYIGLTSPARGSHTGYVTATETSGLIWSTPKAFFKTDAQSSQEDRYCVTNQSVYDRLLTAQTIREKVTINFQNDWWMPIWECNGGISIIRSVE